MKFNENLSKGLGDMERTRKSYGWNNGWISSISPEPFRIGHSYNPLPLRGGGLTSF